MSDTLSDKKRTVKNSLANRNPRPTCPQPSFAETMRLAKCGSRKARKPRRQCDDRSVVRCDERPSDSEVNVGTKTRPLSIAKVQGWIGMRTGVSEKLRKICGSGDEALILNQLVCYWFARDAEGVIRARKRKAHHRWVAKSCKEWADELGMTAKQARRCIMALEKRGFIEVRTWRFQGHNTTHVRPLVAEIGMATCCPEDQRPYRRSERGLALTSPERQRQKEEREVVRMTQYMEQLGRQLKIREG